MIKVGVDIGNSKISCIVCDIDKNGLKTSNIQIDALK